MIRVGKKRLGMSDPLLIQIAVERKAGELPEQSGKMILRETGEVSDLIKTQVFGAVAVNISADRHEALAVHLLTGIIA